MVKPAVYMTTVRLRATSRANLEIEGAAVHDILWARATPTPGLEHVHVMVRPGRVDITIFCTLGREDEASYSAVRTCEAACRDSPVLSGWQVCHGPV